MKKKFIVGGIILLSIVIIIVVLNQVNRVEVETCIAEKGLLEEHIELRGEVALDNKEKVFSKIDGRVKKIMVKEGEKVDLNTSLAEVDAEDLDIALEKSQAAYSEAKANLEELKSSIKEENVKQARVKVEQAKKSLEIAQKDYNYQKENVDKIKELNSNNAASEQDLKDAERLLFTAESALNSAQQSYKIAKYDLDILNKGISQHEIQALEANVEKARLELEKLNNDIAKIYISTNTRGTVLEKYIDEGSVIQRGSLLFEVGDYDSAYIKAEVLTDDAGKIKIGQKAVISGDLLDDKEIIAEIYYIAPKAKSTISSLGIEQQRIEARMKFNNKAMKFKPGYEVDVKIITQEKESAIYIPEKAVFDIDGDDHVFIVENGKLELKNIETGIENKKHIEVLDGVKEGDKIVNDLNNSLKPGIKVKD